MKRCPSCSTQYTDDTLQYCLQDGTPLVPVFGDDTPTVVLGNTGPAVTRPLDRATLPATPGRKKGGLSTPVIVFLTVAAMLGLFAVAGVSAWLYMRNARTQVAINAAVPGNSGDKRNAVNSSPIPDKQTPSPSPAPRSTDEPTPRPVDEAKARAEVTQQLDSWKSRSESLDLNAYMTHYAPTVDYYNKSGASSAFVRSDKQRAFSRYSYISLDLSDLSIKVEGDTATAVFNKEWNFEGDSDSSGKVRQMVRFRRIDGRWLITAEKDLKLYYKN